MARNEASIRSLRDEIRNIESDLEVANRSIEDLTIRNEDATGSIEGLMINIQEAQERIQELQEEYEELESRRLEAEEAYDMQVSLAARAVARRQNPLARVKRERDSSRDVAADQNPLAGVKRERDGSRDMEPDPLARNPKRPRNVITTREDGPVDLTGEETDEPGSPAPGA